MSTEQQRYSTENQADAIRQYAERRGLEVVRTCADEGRSGLPIDSRYLVLPAVRLYGISILMRLYMETSHESDWARGRWADISKRWHQAGHIELIDSKVAADAILITVADCKPSYPDTIASIIASGAYAEHPDKSFVFDTQDTPLGLFPGIYCSLRRYLYSSQRHRTGCYMQSFNEFIEPADDHELRYLFSFQGNLTSKTRGSLFAMKYGRDDVLIERTEPFWTDTGGNAAFKQRYAEKMRASRYVLCPRGIGTSTFRLFETMQSGRVPVILSDAWVPTPWIDWHACSLRVREADIARLPEICLANQGRWEEMARQARSTWERWFSPEGMGRFVRTAIEDVRRRRRLPERYYRLGWPLRHAMVNVRQSAIGMVRKIRR
jgi:hypothetical protein